MRDESGATSRRDFARLALGAGVAALGAGARAGETCRDAAQAPAYHVTELRPLGEIDPGVAWGVHIEGGGVYDTSFTDAIAKERPRLLAVGSGLKFGSLHPSSEAFERRDGDKGLSTWTETDDIVRLAQKLGVPTRGDAMIWNDWLPQWIVDLAKQRPQGWRDKLQEVFEQNFKAIFAHLDGLDRRYGQPVMPWRGLVNEPLAFWNMANGGVEWRPGVWLDAFEAHADGTPGYIHKAFEICERLRGAAKPALYLNEANCDNDKYGPALRKGMLMLVDSLQKAGRVVDAVGLEAHLQPEWMHDPLRPNWKSLVDFLRELQKRGLDVYVTELDVNDCVVADLKKRDQLVTDYTYSFAAAALEVPAVTMITNWDFSDGASWYRDVNTVRALGRWAGCQPHPACPRPTMYNEKLAPKAARDALARALAGRRG